MSIGLSAEIFHFSAYLDGIGFEPAKTREVQTHSSSAAGLRRIQPARHNLRNIIGILSQKANGDRIALEAEGAMTESQDAPKLSFELPQQDQVALTALFDELGISYSLRERDRFSGAELIGVVVTLTPPIVAALTTAYGRYQASKQHVSVKYNGIEVKGVSEKTLLKIIESHQGKRRKKGS